MYLAYTYCCAFSALKLLVEGYLARYRPTVVTPKVFPSSKYSVHDLCRFLLFFCVISQLLYFLKKKTYSR